MTNGASAVGDCMPSMEQTPPSNRSLPTARDAPSTKPSTPTKSASSAKTATSKKSASLLSIHEHHATPRSHADDPPQAAPASAGHRNAHRRHHPATTKYSTSVTPVGQVQSPVAVKDWMTVTKFISLPGSPPIGYANPLGLVENPEALLEPIIKPEADFILIK